jgi:predicted RNase H-like nuclease (RuvC/YqgF family)
MANTEVIKVMTTKIDKQERDKATFEARITSLTAQLNAKEAELREQLNAKDEEIRQMKRELDASEGGRVRVQRELNNLREAEALVSNTASV